MNKILTVLAALLLCQPLSAGLPHVKKSASVSVSVTQKQKELNCLTKNIYREASSEPFKGKLAVGVVTVNRLFSGKYGNTICKVVYYPGQFSWTKEGTTKINNDKWQESLLAASMVLDDHKILGDFNATHFHNRTVNPKWGLRKVAVIGNHTFYGV